MTESDCKSANALATSDATNQDDQLMVLELIFFGICDEVRTYYRAVTFVIKGGCNVRIEDIKRRCRHDHAVRGEIHFADIVRGGAWKFGGQYLSAGL